MLRGLICDFIAGRACSVFCFNSSSVSISYLYTRVINLPQNEKSRSVVSGLHGGQWIGPFHSLLERRPSSGMFGKAAYGSIVTVDCHLKCTKFCVQNYFGARRCQKYALYCRLHTYHETLLNYCEIWKNEKYVQYIWHISESIFFTIHISRLFAWVAWYVKGFLSSFV